MPKSAKSSSRPCRELWGTATLEDTVEEALREVVKAEARREELRALSWMEGMDLANPKAMAGA